MGALTEDSNDTDGFTHSEQQDEVAVRNHRLAAAAEQVFRRRDRPGADPAAQERPDRVRRRRNACRRRPKPREVAARVPRDGTITAGNASQISRTAHVPSSSYEQGQGGRARSGLARRDPGRTASSPDRTRPCRSSRRRCHREGVCTGRDHLPTSTWSKINERSRPSASPRRGPWGSTRTRSTSMAARSRSATDRDLGRPHRPASGARLKRRGGGIGAAALCGAGGQGDALIVSVPKAWYAHDEFLLRFVDAPPSAFGSSRWRGNPRQACLCDVLQMGAGPRAAVRIPGMVHGVVFLAFVAVSFLTAYALKWNLLTLGLALVSSIPPFGTLVFEWWARPCRSSSGGCRRPPVYRWSARPPLLTAMTK